MGVDAEGLSGLILGNSPLFKGYEKIETTGFNFAKSSGSPATLTLTGKVIYADGSEGVFDSLLVKDDEVWKIARFNLNRQ